MLVEGSRQNKVGILETNRQKDPAMVVGGAGTHLHGLAGFPAAADENGEHVRPRLKLLEVEFAAGKHKCAR
jgi:hypothetical protein